MSVTSINWSNKNGTGTRTCKCGSWMDHWIKFSKESWPTSCSVANCSSPPTLGAHIINPEVQGERIVPMCYSCNGLDTQFNLKGGVSLVKANTSETCK